MISIREQLHRNAGLDIYELWETRFSLLDDRDTGGRRTPEAMAAKEELSRVSKKRVSR